jgi:ankyrin repeat protein
MNVLHFVFILPQDQTAMVKMLLKNRKVVENHLSQQCTVDNWTPLILAVVHPYITPELIGELINNVQQKETKEEQKKRIEDETYQLLIAFEKVAQNPGVRTFTHLNPIVVKCPSKVRYQVLHSICRYDRKDMLDWALDPAKGNLQKYINEQNQAGYTPFLTAVFYGATQCIDKLLEVGLLLTFF